DEPCRPAFISSVLASSRHGVHDAEPPVYFHGARADVIASHAMLDCLPTIPMTPPFAPRPTGIEMARIPIPCRAQRYTAKDGPDGWRPTPEPPHRINQIYFEPILFACAAATPGLRILCRTRVSDFKQRENGILAIARNLDSNESFEVSARYLIGCDGAHSDIRHRIGVRFSGDAMVMQVQSTYILAPDLLSAMPNRAWAIYCLNSRSW